MTHLINPWTGKWSSSQMFSYRRTSWPSFNITGLKKGKKVSLLNSIIIGFAHEWTYKEIGLTWHSESHCDTEESRRKFQTWKFSFLWKLRWSVFPTTEEIYFSIFCTLGACKLRLHWEFESAVGNLHQINVSNANATGDFNERHFYFFFLEKIFENLVYFYYQQSFLGWSAWTDRN